LGVTEVVNGHKSAAHNPPDGALVRRALAEARTVPVLLLLFLFIYLLSH